MNIIRRDYCWQRAGLLWEVWCFSLDDTGRAIEARKAIPLRFWRKHNAAIASNAIFEAYNDGARVARAEGK